MKVVKGKPQARDKFDVLVYKTLKDAKENIGGKQFW